jgi:recombination protein RecR
MLPKNIQNLAEEFQKLTGVGKRSSLKLSIDLLQLNNDDYQAFQVALKNMRLETTFCYKCVFFAEGNRESHQQFECEFCKNPNRNQTQICLVEKPTDVLNIEKSQIYRGLYHCLNNLISPLDNIFAENTTLNKLWLRLEDLISQKNL